MSRTLTGGYLSHLAGELHQRALCVKVTRADDEVFGFTSFDDDLEFEGVTYEAAAAVEISDLRASVGSGVDNAEALGALVSGRLEDTDILAGVWDGATFEVFEVIWSDLEQGRLLYMTGQFGEFSLQMPGVYRVELRSLSQHLSQQIVELTQPRCRVKQLFDSRCYVGGVNYDDTNVPGDFRSVHSVASVQSVTEITFASNSNATGYYEAGRVEFQSGLNAGFQREVKQHTLSGGQAVIVLQEAFPFAVAVNDSALLEAGCDRRLQTCSLRFENAGNFRGEPHLPGTDAILVRGRR